MPARPSISVVIPTFNEEGRIGRALEALTKMSPRPEILVADGMSTDETLREVQGFRGGPVRLISCRRRGRGAQMNEGAALAGGEILVFLHADVELPGDAFERIHRVLGEPSVVAGAFRTMTCIEGHGGRAGSAILRLADLRSRYTRLPYGDQAPFVRAELFRRLGGYAEIPLMEDLDLSRRLRREGRVVVLDAVVKVSGRRFVARPIRSALSMNLFPVLYRMGVSPKLLSRLYGDPR